MHSKDFRLLLQNELVKRCENNPRYSLRSFAKQLDVNPATLSSLLAQKRPISEKTIKKLGNKLNLSPKEIDGFVNVTKNPTHVQYQEFNQDLFSAISDWYHDAILELTRIKKFKPDPHWIASVLDISVNEVHAAVERLQRLELLEITPKGKWIDSSRFNTNTLDIDFSTAAMRKYQKKILEKSLHALEELPRTDRDHTSMMVCGNKSDLKKAKKMIAEFRHKLAAFLQRKNSSSEEVYQIAVSLFPITKINEKRRTK